MMTKKEYAALTGFSIRTVDRMIADGSLQVVRFRPHGHPRIIETAPQPVKQEQRALTNEEKRRLIRETAKRMGY
jgi:predicted DNA-binding transcriptional regulator AlpA